LWFYYIFSLPFLLRKPDNCCFLCYVVSNTMNSSLLQLQENVTCYFIIESNPNPKTRTKPNPAIVVEPEPNRTETMRVLSLFITQNLRGISMRLESVHYWTLWSYELIASKSTVLRSTASNATYISHLKQISPDSANQDFDSSRFDRVLGIFSWNVTNLSC